MNDNIDGVEKRSSQLSGNGLFTKRAVAAGAILASKQRPLVTNLSVGIEDACSWCFLYVKDDSVFLHPTAGYTPHTLPQAKLEHCKDCKMVKYCSEACRKEHWEAVHKSECKVLAEHKPIPDAVRTSMQILQGLEKGESSFEPFLELESNIDEVRQEDGEKWQEVMRLADDAYRFAGQASGGYLFKVDIDIARKVTCLALGTAFHIQSFRFHLLGTAQDPLLSTINHSCEPNAVIVWDGPKLTIRALKALDKDQEILISYIDLDSVSDNDVFDWRQTNLKQRFLFTCKCNKCMLGFQGPCDTWAIQPNQMPMEARKAVDIMMRELRSGPESVPHRPASDSVHEKRAAALEISGYHELHVAEQELTPKQMMDRIPNVVAILESSGLFAVSRAPMPALHEKIWKASHKLGYSDWTLLCLLRIHFAIDPIVYPQPYHPRRVVHLWDLAALVHGLLPEYRSNDDDATQAVEGLARRGINIRVLFAALQRELKQTVPRCFGVGSQQMAHVGRHWNRLMGATGAGRAGFGIAAASLNHEQWHVVLEAAAHRTLIKVEELVQCMRMWKDGLLVARTTVAQMAHPPGTMQFVRIGDLEAAAREHARVLSADQERLGLQPAQNNAEQESDWEDVEEPEGRATRVEDDRITADALVQNARLIQQLRAGMAALGLDSGDDDRGPPCAPS